MFGLRRIAFICYLVGRSDATVGRSDAAPLRDAPANTQQLMMAGPSFGLGETVFSQDAGN